MRQRITIAKIAGDSATAADAHFRRWSENRLVDDPNEWSPEQWPPPVRQEMDTFALALRANGHEPPVVFFNEHVDLWSMGDLFCRWFPENPRPTQVLGDRFQLWHYPLPDGGRLAELLRRSTRLKRIRERHPQEDRWFTVNLLEAALAWEPLVDRAALVILRDVFGGLAEDEEIERSLTDVPDWIAGPSP